MSQERLPNEPIVPSRPPTWSDKGQRIWLYPERRDGPYARRRQLVAWPLILIYLIVPFIEIQGRPLFRFDVLERTIYVLGGVFRFNDGPYLFFVILSLALTLFLLTSLKGRFWCSYACPQTVFLEWIIRPVEELIEGKASDRRKKDAKAKNLDYYLRRSLKIAAFIAIACVISHAFLAYFIPPATLFSWFGSSPRDHLSPFVVMSIMTVLLSFDFIYFREQFCSVLCPYTRFQSVLMDVDTPVISYDSVRGEPRAKGGDCIDCDLCIKVCPTGIDIRNGLQLECIQCGRCADACDTIMAKVNKPAGLVRTATIRGIRRDPPRQGIRWRPIIYSGALVTVFSALIITLSLRPDIALTFLRAPGAAYSQLEEGRIGNIFHVRVENNTSDTKVLKLEVVEPKNVDIICVACGQEIKPFEQKLVPVIFAFQKEGMHKSEVVIVNPVTHKSYQLPLVYPNQEKEGS